MGACNLLCIGAFQFFDLTGTPVQTPVWFAEEHGVLYVYTLANAGKVKRIRRHPRIRLAPCTMRGTVTGPWVEAEATIVDTIYGPARAVKGFSNGPTRFGTDAVIYPASW